MKKTNSDDPVKKGITRKEFITYSALSLGTLVGCSSVNQNVIPVRPADSQPEQPQITDKEILEASRTIPVMAETDVLVVGGGPAGISAAIAAAREGVRVILMERYGFVGGMVTQASMGSITWYRYAETVDAGGNIRLFETKADEMGASMDPFTVMKKIPFVTGILEDEGLIVDGKPTYNILDTELFKYVADTLLIEAGVVSLLHCQAVDAIMEGNTIKGIVTESKSGRQAILAKRVIDCTGDADIANFAGVPFHQSPTDKLMGVTTNFSVSGVDLVPFLTDSLRNTGKMKDWGYQTSGKEDEMASTVLYKPFVEAQKAGMIPEDWHVYAYWAGLTEHGEILSMNTVHMYNVDPTDVWDLTEAEQEGRRRAVMFMEALKKYGTGFKNARIRNFHHAVGARESRKIHGAYTITEQDCISQAKFPDTIGVCPEFIDAYHVLYIPTTGRYFQVPYGITLPQKVENLLVAGRCVAGDRVSHGATRQINCCIVTGQGTGVAAAVSLKDGVTCRKVDIAKVQSRLKKQGVRIA